MIRLNSTTTLGLVLLGIIGTFISCMQSNNSAEQSEIKQEIVYDVESPKSMLLAVREACGGIDKLNSLKDVEYDYHYVHPDGTKDVSKERYIFENEISWARYLIHQINVVPELEGNIVHFYDGNSAKVYNEGKVVEDANVVGTGQFLRQANYMWFTMMFKLTDPGIVYQYNGQKEIEGKNYDEVLITYDPEIVGKEVNDTYIVYINPETKMVESFDFSLPAFGIMEPVLHADLTYEEIDGIQVIVRRQMSAPNPDGEGRVPMVDQQLKNVKFNNGFTSEQLSREI